MKKKVVIFATLLILGAVGYGFYLYQKPAESVVGSEAELLISAQDLMAKIDSSEELVNKVVEVSGEITLVEHSNETMILILNEGIKCELKGQNNTALKVGQKVRVKGLYSGFDEMMNEISLSRCQIVE